MTVCIAARSFNVIVAACDRMLTSGDIQFETAESIKIQAFSTLSFMMTAGDSALATELVYETGTVIAKRIRTEPNNIWNIKDIVDLYVSKYNEIRIKRSEVQILAPLGLDRRTFISEQRAMNDVFVSDVSKELLNFPMPGIACIIAGVDPTGSHIYSVHGDQYTCDDAVGFSAIGIGARHASSQLMLRGQSYVSTLSDTVLAVYNAKKRAETAPGVGKETEMIWVGGGVSFSKIPADLKNKLESEYQKILTVEGTAFTSGRAEVNSYVEALAQKGRRPGTGGVAQKATDEKGSEGRASPDV